jgi:hypothetical protein
MKTSERNRLMRMSKKEPISRETRKWAKKEIKKILHNGVDDIWSSLLDDDRDAIKDLLERLDKILDV